MKYIKLFTVELCRGVRREVRLEEPIELNFLKYTILESSETIMSEAQGKISDTTDYSKIVCFLIMYKSRV